MTVCLFLLIPRRLLVDFHNASCSKNEKTILHDPKLLKEINRIQGDACTLTLGNVLKLQNRRIILRRMLKRLKVS